jgi:hypothetical protein
VTVTIPPDVVPSVTAFLGQSSSNTAFVAQCTEHVSVIAEMAFDYTRGKGFDSSGVPLALTKKVIITASARLLANPEQLQYQTGTVAIRGAFEGWSALEKTLLDRYRGTAA